MYGFTLLMKTYVNMNIFFGEKYENRDKSIQSGTLGQHTKTVLAKLGQLEYLFKQVTTNITRTP